MTWIVGTVVLVLVFVVALLARRRKPETLSAPRDEQAGILDRSLDWIDCKGSRRT